MSSELVLANIDSSSGSPGCVLEMDCSDCEGPWRCWSKVKVGGRRYSMVSDLAVRLAQAVEMG